MTDSKLFDTIKDSILQIELSLKDFSNKGVYFAPELHLAFCIGQKIMENRTQIFGDERVEWLREINLGNGGPSDIIFKYLDTNKYKVIELKLRDNYDAYRKDIIKLLKLPENYSKYFCVLLDSFSTTNDERLIRLESEFKGNIECIGHFSFPTWNNWYEKGIHCNINLYSVGRESTQ